MNTLGTETKTRIVKGFDNNRIHIELDVPPRYATIVFDGDLVASNVVNWAFNGEAMAAVTYATSHDNTMDLIITALGNMDTVQSAELTDTGGNNRTIKVVPVDQTSTPSLTGAAVTGGAGQAAIAFTETNTAIKQGQPVKLGIDGEALVLATNDASVKMIGQAIHDALPDQTVTVATRGLSIVNGVSSAAQDAGPVSYDGFNTSANAPKYKAEATAGNVNGWALQAAGDAAEAIEVLVLG